MERGFDEILKEWSVSLTKRERGSLVSMNMDGFHFLRNARFDPDFLFAAVEFWDPKAHCFRFGYDELCPTPEEFGAVFGSPVKELVAIPILKDYYYDEFRKYFDLDLKELNAVILGREVSLDRFAATFFNRTRRDPLFQKRAYVYCMLHKFLLVNGENQIGQGCVQSIVEQIEQGRNPFPVILGETLLCLDSLKENPNAPLKGSPLLLQLWLMERLSLVEVPGNWEIYTSGSVLRRKRRFSSPIGRDAWRRVFENQDFIIRWIVPWWKISKMIGVNSTPYCRLPSLSVLTFYCPSRIMRQYGREQVIPKSWTVPTPFSLRSRNADLFKTYWMNRPSWPVSFDMNPFALSKEYKEWLATFRQQAETKTEGHTLVKKRLGEKKAPPKDRLSLKPIEFKSVIIVKKRKDVDVGEGKEKVAVKERGKEKMDSRNKPIKIVKKSRAPDVIVTSSKGSLLVKESVDKEGDGEDKNWKRARKEKID